MAAGGCGDGEPAWRWGRGCSGCGGCSLLEAGRLGMPGWPLSLGAADSSTDTVAWRALSSEFRVWRRALLHVSVVQSFVEN